MYKNLFAIIMLLTHIISCVLILVSYRKEISKLRKYMLLFLFFLPFIGPMCIYGYMHLIKEEKYHAIFSNEVDPYDEIVEDEKIKDEEKEVSELVPLSDALVMNDNQIRRRMILDVINDDPEKNLALIKEACLNDDTEVVHYATTIISEISAKYEKEIKQAKEEYESDKDSREKRKSYCSLLRDYLEKKLVSGELEKMKRIEYSTTLKENLKFEMTKKIVSQIVDNEIILSRFTEVEKYLEVMKKNWPLDEETWILEFKSLCNQNKINQAKELSEEARRQNIYFSTKNKAFMNFFLLEEDVA